MENSLELTVLVLTLNEARALESLLPSIRAAIPKYVADYEILVIDGGSTDGTPDVARAGGARVERQAERGYGNAYRQGLASARGRFILTLDADGSHPVEMLARYLPRREEQDVINGSRYLSDSDDQRLGLRKYMSLVLNIVYAKVLSIPLTDISGGFRIYRTEAVRSMECNEEHYDVPAELIVRLYGEGCKILELPYQYAPRVAGASKARLLYFSFCYCRTLLRLWWWLHFGARRRAHG